MTFGPIWLELERENAKGGEFRRRIHPEAIADIFLVVHKPDNRRGLLIDADLSSAEIGDLPSGRGISLRWLETSAGGTALELFLTQPAYSDLFDALVGDVASAAAQGVDRIDVGLRVATRVRRWQTFLKESASGLTAERQRGLFGELTFLLSHLVPAVGAQVAATAWVGPSSAPQDFYFARVAVEVKTTMVDQHQVLHISSERQLDTTALEHLVIFHLSVDTRVGAGRSLPELVAEVRSILSEVPSAAALFEERLFEAGYLDGHATLYRTGYTIREANLFAVVPGFPRITEGDCSTGIGDVRYSIAVSSLGAFALDAGSTRAMLREAADRV